jgi:capsular polysaccharide biosynthesis protein
MLHGDQLFELLGTDEYTYVDDGSAEVGTGLTSFAFIKAALRRKRLVWCTVALLGLLAGLGFSVKLHTTYEASTSLLLTPQAAPGEASGAPILNEQAIAQSRSVAEAALDQLGLKESVSSFQATYTVTAPTDRLLVITVSAPSGQDAINRANALASAFLTFRTNLAQAAQNLVVNTLKQEINQAQQRVDSLTKQVDQLSAQPTSPVQQAELTDLRTKQSQAEAILTTIEQANTENEVSSQITTYGVVHDSQVLDTAGVLPPHSRLKRLLEYTLIGLLGGLAVSMGIIVIGALISDRLRQRDEVARALGARVKLSVGTVRISRWQPGRRGLGAARSSNIKRVVAYLDSAVPPSPPRPANLAVVPVDDVQVPATCLASLAVTWAQRGMRVVVADLCHGAPAARLLGVGKPGVWPATSQGADLTVIVPEPDDFMTVGPLHSRSGRLAPAEPVVAACESADLLLTLSTLDPSLGADGLAGWARSAVVMVTAGESPATRIHAAGEMIRLAGMSLISGVLVGVDQTDETLGLPTPAGGGPAADGDLVPGPDGFFITADEAGGRRSDTR